MRTGAVTEAGKKSGRHTGVVCCLLAVLVSPTLTAASPSNAMDTSVYVYAGLDHFYNLEYEEALANFRRALEREPENPIFVNYLAYTYLFRELYRTGQLETRLYTESNAFLKEEKPNPDPAAIETFKELIARSKEICSRRLKKEARDKIALYALGIAHALESSYEFTLAKRWFASLKAGTRAKEAHQKLKRYYPEEHDADMVLGLYEYAVGSIPAAVKWLALLVGYRGSKERGIALLHSAITQGQHVSTNASVLLAVVYNREKQYAYTRALLEKLAEYYPRNYLLHLESAHTHLREGNERGALEVYRRVARKMEEQEPNFTRVPSDRLYYQIGSLEQRLGNYEQALAVFEKVIGSPTADGLISAFSRVRKGEIYLVQNRHEEARQECETVLASAHAEARAQAQQLLLRLPKRAP